MPSTVRDPLEVALRRAGELKVTIIDEAGQPVAGADVILRPKVGTPDYDLHDDGYYELSGPDGAIIWRDIASEPYYVQAAQGELRSDIVRLDVPSARRESIQVTLHRQLAPGSIVARILRRDGTALTPALVSFKNMNAWLGGEPAIMDPCANDEAVKGEADDTGVARASQLAPGHYWVWPNLEHSFIGPKHVLVSAGSTVEVEFREGE